MAIQMRILFTPYSYIEAGHQLMNVGKHEPLETIRLFTTELTKNNKKPFVNFRLPKLRQAPIFKEPLFKSIAVLFKKRQWPEFYTRYFQD